MKTPVVFAFPFRGAGGVPHLFSRCAKSLIEKDEFNLYILDYEGGMLSSLLSDTNVKHITYSDDFSVKLPDDAIIIFQLMTPWSIFKNIRYGRKNKLLFWACHPYNIIPSIPPFRKLMNSNLLLSKVMYLTILFPFYISCKKFLNQLEKNKGLVFMDEENYENIEDYLDYKFSKPKIIPIGVSLSKREIIRPELDSKNISFLWIGRIVDFKYFALKKFISDLSDACRLKNERADFIIIGDGDLIQELKTYSSQVEYINFRFLDHIEIEDLECYAKETDCAVAMGTSAIDCANLGIPTILLDFHYKKFPVNYRYQFLHEQSGSTLGRSLRRMKAQGATMLSIIEQVRCNSDDLSKKSMEYLRDTHDINITVRGLEIAIKETQFEPEFLGCVENKSTKIFYSMFKFLKGV